MTLNRIEIHLKKCLLLIGLLFLIPQPVQATEWGTLSGQFIYTGKPFQPPKIKVTKDQEFCGKFKNHIVNQSLLIGENGGIKNIFIYLRNTKLAESQIHTSYKLLPEKVYIENKDCIIEPHTLGLWYKHQKLIATNEDPLGHNFHLFLINNQTSCSVIPQNGQHTFEFHTKEPLPIKIGCDIHTWESAYLLILDHPYFSTTNENGSFTIKNIPIGDWEFQLWHERTGYLAAKEEWKRGKIKMKIKPGKNDLREIKVAPELFKK